jgi:hypothetical protein
LKKAFLPHHLPGRNEKNDEIPQPVSRTISESWTSRIDGVKVADVPIYQATTW